MSFADAAQAQVHSATSVPAPREESGAMQDALAGLAEVERATAELYRVVDGFDLASVREPSLLPGWSRAHVMTHLARGADALLNLLTWAKTGVEHPMYLSMADREADIAEGGARPPTLLRADLDAASQRLAAAIRDLPATAWEAEVAHPVKGPILAGRVPWMRLGEVWVHLVDLDAGFGFADVPEDLHELLLNEAVGVYADREGVPPVRLEVALPDGRQRTWELPAGAGSDAPVISGGAAEVIGWLTGRGDGSGLEGRVPTLPRWL
ncbi:maleylpyruvate isomerase family mycothiol-dependent enzyme [Actinosynnema pretiosum subsp. pretiosum]|nr:maleylpyruvate isomerase family mycothiol-dependent enzyme [Actinosynnema pretiosum subsp. pretiosum]